MTEISRHWGGLAIGDHGRYNNDGDWSDIWRKLFTTDRTIEGVLDEYAGELEVTNPAGQTIRVATGMAIVDGKFYESDANEDTLLVAPGAGTDYYSMVLRKAFAAQTVRQTLVGPINGGPAPAPTQVDGVTWDLPLAEVRITAGGVVTVIDERETISAPIAGKVVLIAEVVLAAPAASIDFTNIPPFFRHLRLTGQVRSDHGVVGVEDLAMRFNNDAGANYDWVGTDTAAAGGTSTGATGSTFIEAGRRIECAACVASYFSPLEIRCPYYSQTVTYKSCMSRNAATDSNPIVANTINHSECAGWWRSTAAINRITLTPTVGANFVAGTMIALYGIR